MCLRRLSGGAPEAAELHKTPEQDQAPQGEHKDLVILRRKKNLPGPNIQQAELQVDRCTCPKDVPREMKTKFPRTVMGCGLIGSTQNLPRGHGADSVALDHRA